jgi:hypothetical protein
MSSLRPSAFLPKGQTGVRGERRQVREEMGDLRGRATSALGPQVGPPRVPGDGPSICLDRLSSPPVVARDAGRSGRARLLGALGALLALIALVAVSWVPSTGQLREPVVVDPQGPVEIGGSIAADVVDLRVHRGGQARSRPGRHTPGDNPVIRRSPRPGLKEP